MKTELTEVKGIGEKTAEKLLQQGIESVEALIDTAVEQVSLITGFGPSRTQTLLDAAREFAGAEPESEVAAEAPPNPKKKKKKKSKKKKSDRSGKKKGKRKKGKKKKGGKKKSKKAKGKKKKKKRK